MTGILETYYILTIFQGSICCGYGNIGVATKGYDCVMIPGASTFNLNPAPNSICGQGAGLVKVTGAIATTICSKYFHFELIRQNYKRLIGGCCFS